MTAGPSPRRRGGLALYPGRCTSCLVCVQQCPTWCISLQAHPEQQAPAGPGRGRIRSRLVLDRFAVDFGLCMYCGICVEVCPYDALAWSTEPVPAATGPDGPVQLTDDLAAATSHVRPPVDPESGWVSPEPVRRARR